MLVRSCRKLPLKDLFAPFWQWLTRIDQRSIDIRFPKPPQQLFEEEFRTAVRSQTWRRPLADEARKDSNYLTRANGAVHVDRLRLPGILIARRQTLKLRAIGARIADKDVRL